MNSLIFNVMLGGLDQTDASTKVNPHDFSANLDFEKGKL